MKIDFWDTTEAGGGSYPTPPEPKEKCYIIVGTQKVEYIVYANDAIEAKNKLDYEVYDERNFIGFKPDEIISIQVDEDN